MNFKNLLKKVSLIFALAVSVNAVIGQASFTKITSLSELTDGEYLIVYDVDATSGKAMGKYDSSNETFKLPTDVIISSNKITSSETDIVWTFTGTGTPNQFIISRDDAGITKYVEYHGSKNKAYFVETNTDDKTKWDITYASDKFVVNNVASNTSTPRYLKYNTGFPRFACYTGGLKDLSFYKKDVATNTAPKATFKPVKDATNVPIDSKIQITFDEKIYKSGGATEITNADLATLITFKEGSASGSNVAANMMYDNSLKTIGIAPSADLKNSTVYYVAYGAVYDNENAENSGENITFTTKSAAQSDKNDIVSFDVENLIDSTINTTEHTVVANVKYGTDITSLKPKFTISEFATIVDTTTAKDFTTSQTYTVTAENGTAQDWEVTINVKQPTQYTIKELVADNWVKDKEVKTSGIVVANEKWSDTYKNNSFYVQDGTDAKSGIYVFRGKTKVAIGDSVTVVGKTSEYQGLRQIKSIEVVVNKNGATLPATQDITMEQAITSDYQSMLVKLTGLNVAKKVKEGSYILTDGIDSIPVYKKLYDTLKLDTINKKYNIVGVLSAFANKSQLYPRNADDVEEVAEALKPEITDVALNPVSPTVQDDVTVSANISNATDVKLFWGTADGSETNEVDFNKSSKGDKYQGVILKSDVDIYFKITATTDKDTAIYKGSYKVTTTGVNTDQVLKLKVFPNPSNGLFTVEAEAQQSSMLQVNVVNIAGQMVFSKQYRQAGSFSKQIDLSNQTKGIYFIRVNTGQVLRVYKIIIE